MRLALQLSPSKTVTALSMKFWSPGSFSSRNKHVRNGDTSNIKKGGGGIPWRKEDWNLNVVFESCKEADGFSVLPHEFVAT